MKKFNQLLVVTLIAVTTTYFVWFALIFWAYLTTKSVISTSIVAGLQLVITAVTSVWFGSIVDNNKKKTAMLGSSLATLLLFSIGLAFFSLQPESAFLLVSNAPFLVFLIILLLGSAAGNMYNIAVPTLIGLVVPEKERDRANGLFGTVTGISIALTSVASGFILAYGGMSGVLLAGIGGTLLAIVALLLIPVPEKRIVHISEKPEKEGKSDIAKTIAAINAVPGLFALILFITLNNFLGGVFMGLMDAYGLNLVSVEVWGSLFGVLSLGFIASGVYIAKKGVGKSPLRTLFLANLAAWSVCIFFPLQPSIILVAIGNFFWICLFPFMQAAEATIFQKVVPPERLGRIFGFARGVESAASPITAFLIGPIAELVFIPFMTTGKGVELIGDWFGVGVGRGIALVFIMAGIIGLTVTIIAMRSKPYKLLSDHYEKPAEEKPAIAEKRE